jgi:hypothetical protein
VDFIGEDLLYRGEAAPGSAESAAVWRIKRITIVSEDVTYLWALGTAAFNQQWTNRASLSYS